MGMKDKLFQYLV